MFLVSACSCLCAIYWSQLLSRELICSWSNADRWCSNCIWMTNNLIAYWSAAYIRDLTAYFCSFFFQVVGVLFFPAVVVETLLVMTNQPPLDACTYFGLDCGAQPIQVRNFQLWPWPQQWFPKQTRSRVYPSEIWTHVSMCRTRHWFF